MTAAQTQPQTPPAAKAQSTKVKKTKHAKAAKPKGRKRLSTPTVLTILLVALVLLAAVATAITAFGVDHRQRTLADARDATGQMYTAASDFHQALSAADSAGASEFVARQENRATDRVTFETTYESSIIDANSALAKLTAGAETTDNAPKDLLSTLPGQLSEYSVLVESARAYNRSGNKGVATTYQLLAADTMRENLLPAANTLRNWTSDRLIAEEDDASKFPVVELVMGALLIVALLGVQFYLVKRTNRLLNVGLVVATVAAVAMLVWTLVAVITSGQYAEASKQQGTEALNALGLARSTALQARGNETLIVVANAGEQNYSKYDSAFGKASDAIVGPDNLLNRAKATDVERSVQDSIDQAGTFTDKWVARHDAIRKASTQSETKAAKILFDQTGPDVSRVDDNLSEGLDIVRMRFNTYVTSGIGSLTGMMAGVAILGFLVAAGSALGLWQRVREYR